ncbi:MAG: radical SAM family heme chaperone HemW [Proteobacteria bacterium]|nr:radical SAM family heme chaperone HemW [Pseudomonadota bacterium]
MSPEPAPGFGVYVHWPFCDTICPYCDFNVRKSEAIDEDAWRAALINDLRHYAAETTGRTVSSIYFGGGTPSLMAPATIAALIDAVAKFWRIENNAEITIETNPTSAERARLSDFNAAGVNRVSVGVQSLDDTALKFLGRDHSAHDAMAALEIAAAIFRRTTFDLIYARPGQSVAGWRRELTDALRYAGEHVSLYQLTIEPGTPFHRAGQVTVDEDTAADMFELTQEITAATEFAAYEVSNHARPGGESRHNLICWRGGDYVGVGPGAHGRLTLGGQCFGTHQIHNPARWLEKTKTEGHGTAKRRAISFADRTRELLMMGLRLREGVDAEYFRRGIDAAALAALVSAGLMTETTGRIAATAAGRQRLNAILGKLLL